MTQVAANHTLIQPRGHLLARRAGFKPNWFLVALAVVMVVAVALTGWYFSQTTYVPVPELVGQDLKVAQRTAAAQGFQVKTAPGEHDEKVAEGLVLRTDPGRNVEVERGAALTLVPSLGPKRVLVPNVEGMSEPEARTAIGKAGLDVNRVARQANQEIERGKVIRTSPDVGEKVKENSKVNLYVSAGLVMPDVGGMPKDEAANYLGTQGFQVQVNEVDDKAEPCTVIAQAPKAKAEVDKGAQAMITVSRCQTDFWDWFRGDNQDNEARDDQEFQLVPSVVGKNTGDARNELQGLGFRVQIRKLSGDGVVRFQRPAGNSERPPGAVVVLWQ
jgi:serine/threonine-protein kinase